MPHYENILPNGWCWSILGDIFQHNNGKQKTSLTQKGKLYRYITTSNVYWDKFDFSEVKEMHFLESEIEKYTAKKGDLLVCEGGDIGRAAIWNYDTPICIQNHLHRLRAYIPVCTKYFLFSLMNSKAKGGIKGKGIGLMSLSANDLHNIIIALPPLAEQYRIVAEIERWFTLITQIEQGKSALQATIKQTKSKILGLAIHGKLVPQDPNDEPASELLKRINPNAQITTDNGHYGNVPIKWMLATINDIGELLSGRDLTNDECNTEEKGVPYLIGASNIEGNTFSFIRWTEKPQVVSQMGDMLISCKGTIGAIVKNDIGDMHIARQFMAIRSNANCITSDYLHICLNAIIEEIKKDARGVIPGISRDDILTKIFPIPPLNEQSRIVAAINQYYSILDNISANL